MRGSRKFCQMVSNSDMFFVVVFFIFFCLLLLFRGARLQRTSKPDNYRPASGTPFQWRFAGGPIVAHR